MSEGEKKKGREYRQMLEAWSLAFLFPVAIAIGYGWGWVMDKWFGTSPWLTGIFAGFGVIAAFIQFFRITGRDGN